MLLARAADDVQEMTYRAALEDRAIGYTISENSSFLVFVTGWQLSMFLGIDETKIGRIGGGKRRDNGNLDVAMLQSLVRRIGDSTCVPARIASSRGRPVSGDYDNFRG